MKITKYLTIGLFVIGLGMMSSCKKSWTCVCHYSNGTSKNFVTPELKKSDALGWCKVNATYPTSGKGVCELK